MKKRLLPFFVLSVLVSLEAFAQLTSLPPSGGNQQSTVRQYMGDAYVEVNYSSPDVSDREGQIWGQLVPYGLTNLGFGNSTAENPSPWRAGANENTTIEFSHDMMVQGQAIPAGRYGFHMIPQESGPWTLIFSKEDKAWGSYFYNPAEDMLRVEAAPQDAEFREYLTYEFTSRKADSVTLALSWENKQVPFVITLPNAQGMILAAVESELKGGAGFNWTAWNQAASWALSAGYHEKALEWVEVAINAPFLGQRNFTTLSTKASILGQTGKKDEANALMDEAIKLPEATVFQIHAYGRQLISSGEKEKALEVFKYNHKRNNSMWPVNYGLARGYSALGDHKTALKYLKLAKANVPEGDTVNPPVIEANIAKLENGEDIN